MYMVYELRQIYASGNGSTTICYAVKNPRIEEGLNVADVVGTFSGWDQETNENLYKACEPKKLIIGGNFVMVEYTRQLITEESRQQ